MDDRGREGGVGGEKINTKVKKKKSREKIKKRKMKENPKEREKDRFKRNGGKITKKGKNE